MSEQPNILMICLDQMRQDFFGLHGHPFIRTPHMDTIGGNGISFARARSECPTCIPARQTLFTGLDPWGINMFCNVGGQALPEGAPTLPGLLSDNGYQTHAVGKMHWYPERARYGFHEVECDEEYRTFQDGGLHDYERYLHDQGLAHRMTSHGIGPNQYGWRFDSVPEEHSPTHWVGDRACNFLERRDPTRPFFLYASFRQPHPPFVVQPEFWEIYRNIDVPEPVVGDWVESKSPLHWESLHHKHRTHLWWDHPTEIKDNIRSYAAMITHIDAMVGMIVGSLKEHKVYENTWIFLVADHGEMLFDHRGFAKATPFTGSSGIPFRVRPPLKTAMKEGLADDLPRVDREQPVGLADVMPSVLEAVGLDCPDSLQGKSVLPFLRPNQGCIRDYQINVFNQNFGCSDGRYNYCWFGDRGQEMLFDLDNDPRECVDLSEDPAHQSTRDRLRKALHDHLASHDDPHCEGGDLVKREPEYPIHHAALKDKAMHRGRC